MVEKMVGTTSNSSNVHDVVDDNSNLYRNMIIDALRMNQGYASECFIKNEEPNADSATFFNLLKDSENHYRICVHKHSKLSVVAHVFTIKLDYGLSEVDYNKIIK